MGAAAPGDPSPPLSLRRSGLPVREPPVKERSNRRDAERLAQIVVHARPQTPLTVRIRGMAGQGHDRDAGGPITAFPLVGFPLPDHARRFVTVHFRHLAIHEYHVVPLPGQGIHRLTAVSGNIHPAPEMGQHRLPDLLTQGIVLDKQDGGCRPSVRFIRHTHLPSITFLT